MDQIEDHLVVLAIITELHENGRTMPGMQLVDKLLASGYDSERVAFHIAYGIDQGYLSLSPDMVLTIEI
jgi:hypothetical protein